MKILLLAMPYLLKLLDKYLDKNEQDEKLKKDWMNFIFSMNGAENKSKKMQDELNRIMTRNYKEAANRGIKPKN